MAEAEKNFKHIIRVSNTDLEGNKKLVDSLRKIKGVGFMFSNAICAFSGISPDKKTGSMTKQDVEKLETVINDPLSAGIPSWMLNRKKDYETGEDMHIVGATLKYQVDNDVKLLRKIKCYRGMRHAYGLPVRGQKTKNNFRNKKGKAVGVKRKK